MEKFSTFSSLSFSIQSFGSWPSTSTSVRRRTTLLQILREMSEYKFKGIFILVQVSLVIRGRYVLSFWTANLEFAVKKSIFDWKSVILGLFQMWMSEFADKKSANNEGRLYYIRENFYYNFRYCNNLTIFIHGF